MNLRIAEKDDVSLVAGWWRNPQYMGEYQDTVDISEEKLEKVMLEDTIFFLVEKKDGNRIGHIGSFPTRKSKQIGYAIVPSERGKGYGTEAIQLIVDYLFLSKDIVRIEAPTGTTNVASQRALEKAGFSKEGIMRKSLYVRGEHRDMYLYSILREEWKDPKILAKALHKRSEYE